MSVISVAEYPEEGLTILEDENGKFLAFKDKEEIEEISVVDVTKKWLFPTPEMVKSMNGPPSF
jgi:hypothetical protein